MDHATATVCVFAPAPVLTVTIEAGPREDAEVHLHAGGQGVWIARMLKAMGMEVVLCTSTGGETGRMVRAILTEEVDVLEDVRCDGSNGAYVHDRRSGRRQEIADMPSTPLARHDVDALYGRTISTALGCQAVVLGGPPGQAVIDGEVYQRLAADFRRNGVPVVADLSGDLLAHALRGGLDVVKVSDEELVRDRRAPDKDVRSCVAAMRQLVAEGADVAVVTRADEPTVALVDGIEVTAIGPRLEAVDSRGAGDSLTAALTAALARGQDIREGLALGTAAGALNVTRRGLATGDRQSVERLRQHVRVIPLHNPSTDPEEPTACEP